jgi:hypothetical protein
MRPFLLILLLTGSGLLGDVGLIAAQTTEPRNLATDTLQPANPKRYHPISRIGTQNGQVLPVFITGLNMDGKGVVFTWRHPLILPRPKMVFLPSDQIAWLLVNGHYYEPIRQVGQLANGPALRLQAGPRVALFEVPTLSKKRVSKKVVSQWGPPNGLLPMYFYWVAPFDNYFNHTYYLRRPGEKTMTQVPDGKKFGSFLADYLADAPDLAAAIRTGAEGHRYEDVPALLTTYNQLGSAADSTH